MNEEIGNRIKFLMKKENISPQSFAIEIGITPGGLNHILTGRNKPRYDILLKIVSKYKDISLDWLMLGSLPMYKKEKITLSPVVESSLSDTNSNDLSEIKEVYGSESTKEGEIINKSEKLSFESSKTQSFVRELSISEAIEEIRIYFKNKTYLVLKPEK